MLFTTRDGNTFDTERDLTSQERHILQKLFLWETMASGIEAFREKAKAAILAGWNKSGPVNPSPALKTIIDELEKRVLERVKQSK
jgi:hypothetical protein